MKFILTIVFLAAILKNSQCQVAKEFNNQIKTYVTLNSTQLKYLLTPENPQYPTDFFRLGVGIGLIKPHKLLIGSLELGTEILYGMGINMSRYEYLSIPQKNKAKKTKASQKMISFKLPISYVFENIPVSMGICSSFLITNVYNDKTLNEFPYYSINNFRRINTSITSSYRFNRIHSSIFIEKYLFGILKDYPSSLTNLGIKITIK